MYTHGARKFCLTFLIVLLSWFSSDKRRIWMFPVTGVLVIFERRQSGDMVFLEI